MIRAILARLAVRFERDGDSGDGAEFTPSRLDASVLFAHGTGNEAERTIADIEERAQRLEGRKRN